MTSASLLKSRLTAVFFSVSLNENETIDYGTNIEFIRSKSPFGARGEKRKAVLLRLIYYISFHANAAPRLPAFLKKRSNRRCSWMITHQEAKKICLLVAPSFYRRHHHTFFISFIKKLL
jgi:hypothetical protein